MGLGRVADTSWLYAVFDADDPHHVRAQAELMEPRPTLVPAPIMNEFLDLVRYRGGREAARAALRDMSAFPHFDLWYPTEENAAIRAWQTDRALSMHDAHAVALAIQCGFDLASSDKKQLLAWNRGSGPKP